jgi:hypothetical protein
MKAKVVLKIACNPHWKTWNLDPHLESQTYLKEVVFRSDVLEPVECRKIIDHLLRCSDKLVFSTFYEPFLEDNEEEALNSCWRF